MAALDALRRILKAAEQAEQLRKALDLAEQELAAANNTQAQTLIKAQQLRTRVKQASQDFAATLELELPELKSQTLS